MQSLETCIFPLQIEALLLKSANDLTNLKHKLSALENQTLGSINTMIEKTLVTQASCTRRSKLVNLNHEMILVEIGNRERKRERER